MTIQKSELIKQIAESTGLTAKDTETTINALLSTITDNLKSNDKIQFTGFGSFNAKMFLLEKAETLQLEKKLRFQLEDKLLSV